MKTILVTGAFDGFHTGHRYFLTKAKELDLSAKLIVILMGDDYIRSKGQEPMFDVSERFEQLDLHPQVNEILFANTEEECRFLIYVLDPDYRVVGDDYTPEQVVKNDRSKVVLIPRLHGFSSTDLRINKVSSLMSAANEETKAKEALAQGIPASPTHH